MGKNLLYTIEKVGKIVQSIHLKDIYLTQRAREQRSLSPSEGCLWCLEND